MDTKNDIIHIADQLFRYLAWKKPKDGVFEHTEMNASNILLSLIDTPTYVFDYDNLQQKTEGWNGLDHLERIAREGPKRGNFLTKINFPHNSVINHLFYLTVTSETKDKGTYYTHLTLPDINPAFKKTNELSVTPRCIGLHTLVYADPKDKSICVDLCTTNRELQKEYLGLGSDSPDYSELYHHTLFSMTYALENLLCRKKSSRICLPEDRNKRKPIIDYTEVEILEQTDTMH